MRMIYRLLALLLVASPAMALTEVGGIIGSDQRWTMAGSPYVVMSSLLVEEGRTLSIDPGVTVLFQKGTYLRVDGALEAVGTADSMIVFSSGKFPQEVQDWLGIRFTATGGTLFDSLANRSGGSILRHVALRFAREAVQIDGTGLVVDSCVFEENLGCITLSGTRHVFVTGNTFRSNWGSLVHAQEGGNEGRELYDTRIVGNLSLDERFGQIILHHRFITYLEIAHNRLLSPNSGISFGGRIPYDVRSVHIHHNLVRGGIGVAADVHPGWDAKIPAHVLLERNICTETEAGIWIGSSYDQRVIATMNTLADARNGIMLKGNSPRRIEANTFVRDSLGLNIEGADRPLGDSVTHVVENTFAYNRAEIISHNWMANAIYHRNDFVLFDGLAVRNNWSSTIDVRHNYWGSEADSTSTAVRIYDFYDNFAAGRVDVSPLKSTGTFVGPLVPPYDVRAARDADGMVVWWEPSPDPRVTGYRVWYDRQMYGHYARYLDVESQETTAIITDGTAGAGYAVTAFTTGARGLLDQLEGRESWFAFPDSFAPSSIDAWHAPLRLDLR